MLNDNGGIMLMMKSMQGSAGVVSVMVAAAGGCWAAIQLYQVNHHDHHHDHHHDEHPDHHH